MKKDLKTDNSQEKTETSLYRKYRPSTFKEIIGQDHIVSVLKKAIENKSPSHAYLFAGSRGTGKTSVARILANELETSDEDIYEIDAASNRGIDDVRAIREAVHTLPFNSDYKVYIVDEVHMLTKEAFNALLKTLEEPPAHVVFILATTEIEKLPETVVSRCQAFSFKRPSEQVLAQAAIDVARKEGFSLDATSADLIALLGDGSFRDTFGTLQKVISSISTKSGKEDKKVLKSISIEEVEAITGAPKFSLIKDLVEGMALRNPEKAFAALSRIKDSDYDIEILSRLVLEKMRYVLLLRVSPSLEKEISKHVSESELTWLLDLAKNPEVKINSKSIVKLLQAQADAKISSIAHLPLELAIIDLCITHAI
jgi:DNA polymerase III subunit gamma/tau